MMLLITFISITFAGIKPSPSSRPFNRDLFSYLQWGHVNQEQIITRDKDDLRSQSIIGVKGVDIGYLEAIKEIEKMEEVIVAVIDSGVDYTHRDLADNVLFSKKCLELSEEEIKVQNLKCLGKNFTVVSDDPNSKDPMDYNGHGTHVASIIAAKVDNGLGISGLSNKIKIMPLKVYRKEDFIFQRRSISKTTMYANAIVYAVNNGAKVINLSGGWPSSNDTTQLRQALIRAMRAGVIIVAAAGNNRSNEPILPCAHAFKDRTHEGKTVYHQVICVGSLSADNTLSSFSNYGSHVDLIAPGDNILGLLTQWEGVQFDYMERRIPEFFPIYGMEVMSGTSQSAPYVAGIAAILKGLNPDISSDQVYASLIQGTKAYQAESRTTLAGRVYLPDVLEKKDRSLIQPIFKPLKKITTINNKIGFEIVLKNYKAQEENVNIKISSLSEQVAINYEVNIESFDAGSVKTIQVRGDVLDELADSQLKLKVEINDKQYFHQAPIVKRLERSSLAKKKSFEFKTSSLPFIADIKGKIELLIATVSDPLQLEDNNTLYFKRIRKKESSKLVDMRIHFYEHENNKVIENSKRFNLSVVSDLLSIHKIDIDYDGKAEFLVRVAKENSKTSVDIQYHILDKNLNPVYNSPWIYPIKRYSFDVSTGSYSPMILNTGKMFFIKSKVNFSEKKLAIPHFMDLGQIPEYQQYMCASCVHKRQSANRVYSMMPSLEGDKVIIKPMVIEQQGWRESELEKYRKSLLDELIFSTAQRQSQADFYNSQAKVLYSIGLGMNVSNFALNITEDSKYSNEAVSNTTPIASAYTVSGKSLINDSNPSLFFQSRQIFRFQTSTLDGPLINDEDQSFQNTFIKPLAYFEDKDEQVLFLNRRRTIDLYKIQDKQIKARLSKPVNRFSFLTGKILNEFYFPIVAGGKAALYVDSTLITNNRIYIYREYKNALVSPIKYSFEIPTGCRAINLKAALGQNNAYQVLCKARNNGWDLFEIPLN
jgi:hypothetical protein